MDKTLKAFGALDWALAALTIATGLYLAQPWLVAAGAVGLVIAYLQPAQRVQAFIKRKMLKKARPGEASLAATLNEEAFYAQMLADRGDGTVAAPGAAAANGAGVVALPVDAESAARSTDAARVPHFGTSVAGYRATYIARNRHNRLTLAAFNLARREAEEPQKRVQFW